jgi:hypothetical protein
MQTEMKSLHHDPEFAGLSEDHGDGVAAEHAAVEEEVTRIIDEHYEEKPSLEYLFSKLKKKVDTEKEKENEEEGKKKKGTEEESVTEETDKQEEGSDAVCSGDKIDTHSEENVKDDTSDDVPDDISSEETRVLICVSILNEAIFSGSIGASAGGEGGEDAAAKGKRRVHCLSTVGFAIERGR